MEQQENTILTFEEFLKGAKKRFQEAKMRGAHQMKWTLSTFKSNVEGLQKRTGGSAHVHADFNKLLLFSRLVVLL